MNNRFLTIVVIVCVLFYVAESCQKNGSTPATSTQSITDAVASLQAISVGSITASGSAADSIYVIHTCSPHSHRDTIAFSSLPSAVTNYLNSNYASYTPQKAFTVTDSSGAAAGYIVIIQYNNAPVGLKFDASGNFVSVLEQRLGRDLQGDMDGDSTYMHHNHPFDSTHVPDGDDSTHVFDSTQHHGEPHDSTDYDHDSTHHH